MAVEEIFEVGTRSFESRRLDVCQVVGNDIELRLHGRHSGGGGIEGLNAHESDFLIWGEYLVLAEARFVVVQAGAMWLRVLSSLALRVGVFVRHLLARLA